MYVPVIVSSNLGKPGSFIFRISRLIRHVFSHKIGCRQKQTKGINLSTDAPVTNGVISVIVPLVDSIVIDVKLDEFAISCFFLSTPVLPVPAEYLSVFFLSPAQTPL